MKSMKSVVEETAIKHGFDNLDAYLEWKAAKVLGRPITEDDKPIPLGVIFLYDHNHKFSEAELKDMTDWGTKELKRLREEEGYKR